MNGYDIIGDIHGREAELKELLNKLGYKNERGVWRHSHRTALFIGDFIDRYPARGVLAIVRPMVAEGTALAIMGNHELNAIAYHHPDPDHVGEYLRARSAKNRKQHAVFREEFSHQTDALDEAIAWFKTLPLWLDLGDLRAVHAAWHEPSIACLQEWTDANNCLTDEGIIAVHQRGAKPADAVEKITKGIELTLPDGMIFHDKDSNPRYNVRIKWWRDQRAPLWADIAIAPPEIKAQLPREAMQWPADLGYPQNAPPVFIGHYWRSGETAPLTPNVACVDYSVARPGGKLVAYRWSGERVFGSDHFVAVPRQDEKTTCSPS